jgi:putative transposase
VVIGDLSQRQMVITKREGEIPKERRKRQIRNRMVYNDWGLCGFVQMWVRRYRCENCGLVMDRDENSAVNIYERFLTFNYVLKGRRKGKVRQLPLAEARGL